MSQCRGKKATRESEECKTNSKVQSPTVMCAYKNKFQMRIPYVNVCEAHNRVNDQERVIILRPHILLAAALCVVWGAYFRSGRLLLIRKKKCKLRINHSGRLTDWKQNCWIGQRQRHQRRRYRDFWPDTDISVDGVSSSSSTSSRPGKQRLHN